MNFVKHTTKKNPLNSADFHINFFNVKSGPHSISSNELIGQSTLEDICYTNGSPQVLLENNNFRPEDKGSFPIDFFTILNTTLLFLVMGLIVVLSFQIVSLISPKPVQAQTFGLKNDYETVLAQNNLVASLVPLPLENLDMTQQSGDKRVVALYWFLLKYKSPMASFETARNFVTFADANGFGDKYTILPAISGIESGFGRLIPYNANQISHNAWGWGGPGNWYYFDSWDQAIERISAGLAKGYGATGMDPDKMVWAYCPPCAQSGDGVWQRQVKIYQKEIRDIEASLQ